MDKDHGEGYSTAKLELSPSGYGLFHGNIDMTVPQTGRIKSAGYANMQALQARVIKAKQEINKFCLLYI